ncbi:ornithine cyclodeaminase family protein [Rhizobium sp. TRM95111]|uniref:ornithine cyclodeaminase family protein n=1 Tax=Rhizobium alarense TaxID=2846851 RepID=UPI001F33C07E|nr:ornithine cyclodeaminase family protein [Rhizobium alarense]MCF3642312.1 ornithine cyclodeaminase family protein [Rhizobium alarense]
MLVLDADQTRDALPFPALIEALSAMFAGDCVMPVRHHHAVAVPGEEEATLLLMPAWQPGAHIGVKLVTVFPGNHRRALPAIFGSYLLSSGKTGELLAILDGGELTARRTAAASALAARHLARPDSRRMLMVGAGRLSLNLIAAHSAVLPIGTVGIWARDAAKAEATAAQARAQGFDAVAAPDLEAAARTADLISCATLSDRPLVLGDWLKPGTHLDLVGAFKATMRETDDTAVLRSSLFADTRAGVLGEGGDILQPLRAGLITADAIRAELRDLVTGAHPGRRSAGEITLFKSVGAALEDLAGAILAYRSRAG